MSSIFCHTIVNGCKAKATTTNVHEICDQQSILLTRNCFINILQVQTKCQYTRIKHESIDSPASMKHWAGRWWMRPGGYIALHLHLNNQHTDIWYWPQWNGMAWHGIIHKHIPYDCQLHARNCRRQTLYFVHYASIICNDKPYIYIEDMKRVRDVSRDEKKKRKQIPIIQLFASHV